MSPAAAVSAVRDTRIDKVAAWVLAALCTFLLTSAVRGQMALRGDIKDLTASITELSTSSAFGWEWAPDTTTAI